MLADDTVDMVMICTRHNLHATMAIKAAEARKAIFLEKPMALNQMELDELVMVLKETQVPFMIGFNRRFSPAARRAKGILVNHQSPLMILYRVNAGYLPPTHWTQTEEGGGRIIGEACHIFDLFQYLVGAPVAEVSATAIMPKSEHVLAGDNVAVTLRYKDGSVATLLYTALGSPDFGKEYMELYTDGKVVILDDYFSLRVEGSALKGWKASVQDKGHLEELRVFADHMVSADHRIISLDTMFQSTYISLLLANHRAATRSSVNITRLEAESS